MASRPGTSAFGSLARHFAGSVEGNESIVVLDHTAAAEGLADCVRRRFQGERFYVRMILPAEDALRVNLVATWVMTSFRDADERRVATQQSLDGSLSANGRPLHEMAAYPLASLRLLQAAVRLSDGVIVSSEAERHRVQNLLKTDPAVFFCEARDANVPSRSAELADSQDAIVLWAPQLSGDAAMPFAVALADLHAPKLVVSQTPPEVADQVEWVSPERSADALCRARVIIDTNSCNADSAVALAQWNRPLAVDGRSGAQERLTPVRAFDRRQLDSIYDAVISAMALPPPRIVHLSKNEPYEPAESEIFSGPLVSIVIPTYDRPELLRYALESCRRQTYRNIEVVVGIGGGKRYDDLASEYPDVRFVHLDANVAAASLNAAFAQATGEYVAILNDDDVYFPNHVSLLAGALERSGAMAAHGDVLTAFLQGSGAQWSLYGFQSNTSRAARKSALLVANYVGAMSIMIRRASLGATLYDMTIPLYRDYALWLRIANDYDIVHVERITSCYTIRNHGSEQQTQLTSQRAVDAFKAIYSAFPVQGRPHLEQQRSQQLQTVAQSSTFSAWSQPAGQIAPMSWPPF